MAKKSVEEKRFIKLSGNSLKEKMEKPDKKCRFWGQIDSETYVLIDGVTVKTYKTMEELFKETK